MNEIKLGKSLMKEDILKVLSNDLHGNYIRERGEPQWNPFMWPDGEIRWLEKELENIIIRHTQQKQFQRKRQYLRYKVREFLWEVYKEKDPTEDEINKQIIKHLDPLKITSNNYTVVWSIYNFKPPEVPLPVDRTTIGKLETICDKEIEIEINKRLEDTNCEIIAVAKIIIEAPGIEFAGEVAKAEIDMALNKICSAMPRDSSNLGDFYDIEVGDYYFVIDESSKEVLDSKFVPNKPRPVLFPPEIWNDEKHWRWKAPPWPWEEFPDNSIMRKHLSIAYQRFGQAVRNEDKPDVCLCLAISSIETLLYREDHHLRNKEVVGAFLILASIEGKASIPPPPDIIDYYIMRNEILHEGRTLGLKELDTTEMLWDVYSVLDLLADTAIQNKTLNLLSLMKVLATISNIKTAKIALKKEMDRLGTIQTEYFTSDSEGSPTLKGGASLPVSQ